MIFPHTRFCVGTPSDKTSATYDPLPSQSNWINTAPTDGVNWIQSSASPTGDETSLEYWNVLVPVGDSVTLTAGAEGESPSSGAGTATGVDGVGAFAGVPVPTITFPSATIGRFSIPVACTNAALTQPLPSGPFAKLICSHAPAESFPVNVTTSFALTVPSELKFVPGPLRTFNCC